MNTSIRIRSTSQDRIEDRSMILKRNGIYNIIKEEIDEENIKLIKLSPEKQEVVQNENKIRALGIISETESQKDSEGEKILNKVADFLPAPHTHMSSNNAKSPVLKKEIQAELNQLTDEILGGPNQIVLLEENKNTIDEDNKIKTG